MKDRNKFKMKYSVLSKTISDKIVPYIQRNFFKIIYFESYIMRIRILQINETFLREGFIQTDYLRIIETASASYTNTSRITKNRRKHSLKTMKGNI